MRGDYPQRQKQKNDLIVQHGEAQDNISHGRNHQRVYHLLKKKKQQQKTTKPHPPKKWRYCTLINHTQENLIHLCHSQSQIINLVFGSVVLFLHFSS